MSSILAALALVVALVAAVLAVARPRARRGVATPGQRATYEVLHTASLATSPLRAGLTPATATPAARHLRSLVGASGFALLSGDELLAFDGNGAHHDAQLVQAAR